MASKESYKQDLVISIRYKNDLPPPPMPPKLLEIDTGGLQQYLDPGFAASITKREEPNIEADAEGGMPIDVIGMYGYFDGDESSVMFPEIAPPLDPEDELLMLNPEQLKAGGTTSGNSNFLRKTQYMTAASASTAGPQQVTRTRQRRESVSKKPLAREDKENIKRNIQKAFDLAYPQSKQADSNAAPLSQQERTAWTNPVHPTNRSAKPVSFHSVLPDLDATTATGLSWSLLRFEKPPLPALKPRGRDNRIDGGYMMVSTHPDKSKAYEEQLKAYQEDPNNFDNPGNQPSIWTLYVPKDQAATPVVRRIMNNRDPEHDSEALLARVGEADENDDDRMKVPILRQRVYDEASSLNQKDARRRLVFSLPKGTNSDAHYYTIDQIHRISPENKNHSAAVQSVIDEELPDQLMIQPRDLSNLELYHRFSGREDLDPAFAERYADIYAKAMEEAPEEEQPEAEAVANTEGDGDVEVEVKAAVERQIEDAAAVREEDVTMDDAD